MLYKVWAQNCRAAKRIVKANEDDLREVFDKIFNNASERGLIDTDIYDEDGDIVDTDYDKLDEAFSKITEYWEKNKEISAGDYMIVDVDSINDIIIPNACYGDESFIF